MMNPASMVVLLAEDYTPDVRAAQRAWKKAGLPNPLMVVRNGEECLDYLYQRGAYNPDNAPRPGLLLLDIKMPKMDGAAVLSHLRRADRFGDLPVIMLTSSQEQFDVMSSKELGANAYLVKPLDVDSLRRAIRSASLPCELG